MLRKCVSLFLVFALLFATGAVSVAAPDNGVNMILNGQAVTFTVKPESSGGNVMVPAAEFAKKAGLKATESADKKEVVIAGRFSDVKVSDGDAKLYLGGEAAGTMDVKPYMKDGQLMAQLSALCDALEIRVHWNGMKKSVVVTDVFALLEIYETEFTIMDRLLQTGPAPDKTYKMAGDIDISMSGGDMAIDIPVTFDLLSKGGNVDGSVTMDMSSLLDALIGDYAGGLSKEERDLLDLLRALKMDIIFNADETVIYICCPTLNKLLGDSQFTADTWLMIDAKPLLSDIFPQEVISGLFANDGYVPTLYDTMLTLFVVTEAMAPHADIYPVYELINDAMLAFFADSCFKTGKSGGYEQITYTLTDEILIGRLVKLAVKHAGTLGLKASDLAGAQGDLLGAFQCELTYTVTFKGENNYETQLKADFSGNFGGEDIKLGADISSATPGKTEGSVNISMAGAVIELTMDITVSESTKTLRGAPPKDAKVIDIYNGVYDL